MVDFFVWLCDEIVWGALPVVLILAAGVWFCFRLRFRHITRLYTVGKIFSRGGGRRLNAFEVFALTTGGKAGVGNIVGVSVALVTGGPGSIFWMMVFAVVGAAISYAECRLGALAGGGPPVYMRKLLNWNGLALLFSGLVFAVEAIFMPAIQVNAAAASVAGLTGHDGPLAGAGVAAVMALLFLILACRGEKKIAAASAKILPPAAIVYLMIAAGVIVVNIGELPGAVRSVLGGALTVKAAGGGALATAVAVGVKRGMFTSEAGYGIAPYSSAAAEGCTPDEHGLIQSLAVLFDTCLMCGMTAFMLLCSGTTDPAAAARDLLGDAGGYAVSALVVVFAFATVLCCGFTAAAPCFGAKRTAVFIMMAGVMICGGAAAPEIVWAVCDLAGGVMAWLNITAVTTIDIKEYINERFSRAVCGRRAGRGIRLD